MTRLRVPKLLTLFYTHNPFYLISACLFVYGLKRVFRPGPMDVLFEEGSVAYIDPWFLMLSLCGVTALMTVTALLVVRLGRVWEDARSLVLVLLLMFLAISVSFDEIVGLESTGETGLAGALRLLGFGLCFSISSAELLLRGLKIRLSWLFRAPFYGFLALFFAFPLTVARVIADVSADEARWRIAAFPLLAGLITLTLLPAVRRGAELVRNNGTPWRWPWFPWSVFGFLAFAVCFRSYTLAISFDTANIYHHYWDTCFGVYFLVPFLLAVLLVLFEIGVVQRIRKLQTATLLTAPVLILLSYPWLVPWDGLVTYTKFANAFVAEVASPVFLTVIGLMAFYAWAWIRGAAAGETGVIAMLLLAVFIGPRSFGHETWTLSLDQVQAWPLIAIAALETIVGVIRGNARETLVGSCAMALAVGLLITDTPLAPFRATISYHLILASVLTIAVVFTDQFARCLRLIGAPLLVLTCGAGLYAGVKNDLPVHLLAVYLSALTALAFGYGLLLGERWYIVAGMVQCGAGFLAATGWAWRATHQVLAYEGTRPLLLAVVCFLIAVGISALKGGVAERLGSRGNGPGAGRL